MAKKSSLLALLLLVPVPSIGVLTAMVIAPNHVFGKLLFFISKFWILLIPIFWLAVVEKQKLSWSKPNLGGFGVAAGLGILISIIIFAMYLTAGKILIEPQVVKDMAVRIGLASPYIYLAGAAYWILVNSVLEEYVWRWFVVRQCRAFMPPWTAIVVSAICFTLHHIIAMQVYFSLLVVVIASLGIFIGGALWSWCYLRYQSIWPGYFSHAVVDVTVFAIGYHLIFQ
ncbi:MAG: CPBP family intramembrane glutamic endopeptidase [Planctomycetota bacterium]|jgi:membrane protease YdiL (CAAX protease family)